MENGRVTRRRFVREGTAAAVGIAVGVRAARSETVSARPAPPATQPSVPPSRILNYNQNMEYRRLGKTGLMISAIALGGHWKKLTPKPGSEEFRKNRRDVLSACIDAGINYVDACVSREVLAYAEALRNRRDRMYLGYSWYEHEMRFAEWRTSRKLLEGFDAGLKEARLEYVDLWRMTCLEPGGKHTPLDEEVIIEALEKARKSGKARFVGISSHDRDWLKMMIEKYPQLQVILTPYTAGSKEKPQGSLFDAVRKQDVGLFGIKPFSSGSLFRSGGKINPDTQKIDDERARLALRYVLANDALTAPIPGLISVEQVKNAALAVAERRQFDMADARRLDRAVSEMWANLPEDYHWLRDWEWV